MECQVNPGEGEADEKPVVLDRCPAQAETLRDHVWLPAVPALPRAARGTVTHARAGAVAEAVHEPQTVPVWRVRLAGLVRRCVRQHAAREPFLLRTIPAASPRPLTTRSHVGHPGLIVHELLAPP
jgi:hypothetical protein